jgi:hypothetical protein
VIEPQTGERVPKTITSTSQVTITGEWVCLDFRVSVCVCVCLFDSIRIDSSIVLFSRV